MAKQNKKISRNEIITIGIIAVVALAAAAIWAFGEVQNAISNAESESFKQDNQTAFSMGETMHLDAEEDAQTIDPNGEFFEADFTWDTGTMDVTINSATLYDNPEAAGIPASQIHFGSALKQPFLLVKATVKNVNVHPEFIEDPELSTEKEGLYGIDFLKIPSGELCYFDGTSPKASEKQAGDFELEPGQEKQFAIGFCVQDEDSFNNILDIGIIPGKYWVVLDIDNKREGV